MKKIISLLLVSHSVLVFADAKSDADKRLVQMHARMDKLIAAKETEKERARSRDTVTDLTKALSDAAPEDQQKVQRIVVSALNKISVRVLAEKESTDLLNLLSESIDPAVHNSVLALKARVLAFKQGKLTPAVAPLPVSLSNLQELNALLTRVETNRNACLTRETNANDMAKEVDERTRLWKLYRHGQETARANLLNVFPEMKDVKKALADSAAAEKAFRKHVQEFSFKASFIADKAETILKKMIKATPQSLVGESTEVLTKRMYSSMAYHLLFGKDATKDSRKKQITDLKEILSKYKVGKSGFFDASQLELEKIFGDEVHGKEFVTGTSIMDQKGDDFPFLYETSSTLSYRGINPDKLADLLPIIDEAEKLYEPYGRDFKIAQDDILGSVHRAEKLAKMEEEITRANTMLKELDALKPIVEDHLKSCIAPTAKGDEDLLKIHAERFGSGHLVPIETHFKQKSEELYEAQFPIQKKLAPLAAPKAE